MEIARLTKTCSGKRHITTSSLALFLFAMSLIAYIDCNSPSIPIPNTTQSGKQTFQFDTTLSVQGAIYNTKQGNPPGYYTSNPGVYYPGSTSACESTGVAVVPDTFNLANAKSCMLSYITTRTNLNGGICYIEVSKDMKNWFSVLSLSESVTTATIEDADLSLVCGESQVRVRFKTPQNCGSVADYWAYIYADWPVISWKVWDIKVVVE
jgi:hypothetical protein